MPESPSGLLPPTRLSGEALPLKSRMVILTGRQLTVVRSEQTQAEIVVRSIVAPPVPENFC
jgi:hypothetical protein